MIGFVVFNSFTFAFAVDNNCPLNIVHILQVRPALLCVDSRLDTLENTSTSGETNTASNLGNEGLFAQKAGVDLQFKGITNGTGIVISSNTTHIIINSTASGGESTVCTNLGSVGEGIYASGNCDFKKLLGTSCLSLTANTTRITLTNTCPENTSASNLGTVGEGVFASESGDDLRFKKLLAGSSISLSSNGTRITITNTDPDNTVCVNLATSGEGVYASGECSFKRLKSGTGITLSSNSTHVIITNTYTCTSAGGTTLIKTSTTGSNCDLKGLTSGTGISITSNTNDNAIGNTGVISNSCSNGITCSGTNPSTFTVSWEKLCQTALGSSATSITCSGFTARQHLYVNLQGRVVTSTITTAYQFNSDTGANYAHRSSLNGAAQVTSASTTDCRPQGATTIAVSEKFQVNLLINNNQAGDRKTSYSMMSADTNTSAATAPTYATGACKWDNTGAQITTISFIRSAGTGSYDTNTELTVWGYD